MVKRLVTYVTKRMADAILKTISIKHKIVNIKKHLPIVVQTSKTLYCHQFFADFTYFMSLARELLSQSWLMRMALLCLVLHMGVRELEI